MKRGGAALGRVLDRVPTRASSRLGPEIRRLEQTCRELAERTARLEQASGDHAEAFARLEARSSAALDQAQIIQRRLFYAAVTELARRYAADAVLPPGPDLTRFELRVYSQNGEDGVIAEILRRIGPGSQEFVEFGVESGLEGNCVALADIFGWRGLFLEGDEVKARALAWKYRGTERVRTMRALVTAEKINELLAEGGVSSEPDVLSIDIDGNDLWVWRAITHAQPRLVVIEYNAHLDQTRPLTVPYDPERVWRGTDYFGASLAALRIVADEKGYRLVHTDIAGVNAFFVRDDLAHAFVDVDQVPQRSENYFGTGVGHPVHPSDAARYVELGRDESIQDGD